MSRLLQVLEVAIEALLWVAVAAGLLMMVHVCADVVGRTVFNQPLQGTTEIVSAYYMIAAAYLPWAYMARTNGHISVDLFTNMLPRPVRRANAVFVDLVLIAYLALFTWQTTLEALRKTAANEVWQAAGGYIPVWPSRWVLPIAGGLMLLYLVLRLFGVRSARSSVINEVRS